MRALSQGGTVVSQGRIIVWNSIKIVQCIITSDGTKKVLQYYAGWQWESPGRKCFQV